MACFTCIFGSPNQWASARKIDARRVGDIGAYERRFGKTIVRGESVEQRAARGLPYDSLSPLVIAEAMSNNWSGPIFIEDWTLPAGAFGESTGPT